MESIWQQTIALFNIFLAGLLASFPGLEREVKNRAAGLRTFIIVGMSSAMLTTMALMAFSKDSAARMIANLITGIGFLGGGVIFHRKGGPSELTTAASIWTVALIGIVVGYGYYVLAVGATLMLMVVLSVMRVLEDRWFGEKRQRIFVSPDDDWKRQEEETQEE
jgi:putative Mg2+ transporter-C (MgtC) family protein